jgi:hypothetical protein
MFMNDTIIFRDRSQLVESGDLVLFRDSIQSAGGGAWRLKDGIKTAGKNGEVKTWHKNHDSLSKMEVYLAFQAKKTWWTHQNDHGGVTLLDFIWFRGFYMSEGPGLLRQVRKIDV